MKVLFVCEGNTMRSPMAEAFYNTLTGTHDASSAGALAERKEHVDHRTAEAMKEVGIDTWDIMPRQLRAEMIEGADMIIYFPSDFMPDSVRNHPRAQLWDVVDPHYHPEEELALVQWVRDDIKQRVERLIAEQNV